MAKSTITYKRRLAREKALQTLYAYELSKEPIPLIMEQVFTNSKSHEEDFSFAKQLVYEVIRHQEELGNYIKEKVAHWEYNRIAIIDRILLNMGICELLYFPDIPPKVTINEAIEIAKIYSTEQSGGFLNGVLDAILDDLKSTKSLKKTGRGLLSQSMNDESK